MGFLDLRRVSSSPELESLLLSVCSDAPQSITNSRVCGLFEEGAFITQASEGESNGASSLCFELKDIVRQVPCFSAGASFLWKSFLKCPVLDCWRKRIAIWRFALLHNSLRWTLSFPNFCVPCALGEVDAVVRSQFSPLPAE